MFCKNCGNQISDGAVVCVACGVEVGKGNKHCPNCGAQPDPLASVCVNCGVSLKKVNNAKLNKEEVNSLGDAIKVCFQKYAVFSGRANRSEYWYFALFNLLLSLLFPLAAIALLLPSLAVCVRRLHDIGKSGWSIFIALIPVVGFVILLVWVCQPSQVGSNEYDCNNN